tara:strand:+ start:2331 stop:3716 length:1386 start_codon:yes stop_codon:yes gene_type:complete
LRNKTQIIKVSSISNIFYSFSNVLVNLILMPIFLEHWGVNLYGEWLLIFFSINGLVFLIQPSITVDSVHLSRLFIDNKEFESIKYFIVSGIKVLLYLFIFYLVFIFVTTFYFDKIQQKLTYVQDIKNIIIFFFYCSALQIIQLVFFSLLRSRSLSYLATNLLSFKIIIIIIFTYILLNTYDSTPSEYIKYLFLIESIILLIFVIRCSKFFYFKDIIKLTKSKINLNKYFFDKKLIIKKKYMFMFHSSELINYNLLPILIGLFFKTSMVSIYNIHFLLSRIPKIMTTSLYQAFRLELAQFKSSKSNYYYSLILLSLSFWCFLLYLLIVPLIINELILYLSSNKINLDSKLFLLIFIFSSIEVFWKSLILPFISSNNHEKISKYYFSTTLITFLIIIIFHEIKEISNFNFLFILIFQNFFLLLFMVNIFAKKFHKKPIDILRFIFKDFFNEILKLFNKYFKKS